MRTLTRSARWPRPRSQNGQVFALVAVSMLALIAMAAFVVDVGVAYRAHRRTQAAADASALGAAQLLPGNTSAARTAAVSLAAQNLPDGNVTTPHPTGDDDDACSVNPCFTRTYVSNDTVTVWADTTSPGVFARALNVSFDTFKETAKATATVGSYKGWSANIAPWVTDRQSITWGQTVQFKTDQAGQGNFGADQLPIKEYTCAIGTGGNDYRDLIGNIDHSCLVSIGDVLSSKTGNLAGPTKQGLDERVVDGIHVIQNFDPYSILQQLANGSYVLKTYSHPNLIVIPVADSIGNGRSSYTVVGFAWFIITSYTSKTVDGMFIGSNAPGGAKCDTPSGPAACPVGGYDPSNGLTAIRLAG